MNKPYLLLAFILLNLTYPAKIFAGTLSSSEIQQADRTVRFDVKDTENEPIIDSYWIDVYDVNNNPVRYVNSNNPKTTLPAGSYTYQLYMNFNNLCQPIDSFTVKDEDTEVAIIVNKVRFHFSGPDGIEKGLRIEIVNINDPYFTFEINTDDAGYSFTNLLPGTYKYKAIQNVEVAGGLFQVFPNLTQDITAEITGFRLYHFYLKVSTGETITNAIVHLYDSNGNYITHAYSGSNIYLSDNKTFNYEVSLWDLYIQTEMKSFTVNEQNVSTTVIFYPVTFKLRKPDGSKLNYIPSFSFKDKNYSNASNSDENSDPFFVLPSGHYTYNLYIDSSYPEFSGSFDVDSTSQVINFIDSTREVKFEIKDTEENYLPGSLKINNTSISVSTWENQEPITIHLMDGEYDYAVSIKSLSGNIITNRGKVKADSSKVIPVTFYSVEFSVKVHGNPIPGSTINLWQVDPYYNNLNLYTNNDGKVRDYVSNGLYHYTIEPAGIGSSSSGTFSADSQNVNINADFYSVRIHIGQSPNIYYIYIKNADTGERFWFNSQENDSIFTTYLTPGNYAYNINNFYYYPLLEGTFTIDDQTVDINELFLPHHFIISNPNKWYIYGFLIQKNNYVILLDTYINNMDTLMYYLPKGEYSYKCNSSDLTVSGYFKVENPGDTTNILFVNTGIQTIATEDADFKIYPNPAKDMIWFDAPVDGDISISAMDGKTALQKTLHQQNSLNISQLRKGTYIVKINDNKSQMMFVKKLVVK